MISRRGYRRLVGVLAIWMGIFLILVVRLFYLQIIRGAYYSKKALACQMKDVTIPPARGKILDRNGEILAMSVRRDAYWCFPDSLDNVEREKTDSLFALFLGTERGYIEELLREKKNYTCIAEKVRKSVSNSLWKALHKARVCGIDRVVDYERIYPYGSVTAHITGCAGPDGGLEGIELHLDSLLAGRRVKTAAFADALGRTLPLFSPNQSVGNAGCDIYLTIDIRVQQLLDKLLRRAVVENRARSGSAAVIDPATGEILAISSYPNYDPNRVEEAEEGSMRFRAITDPFEPGSTFKLVTLAALLTDSLVSENDSVYCENGSYSYCYGEISDVHPYGWLTVEDVFVHSSNVGVGKLAIEKLTTDKLYKMARYFGFGSPTGVELPGETKGVVKKPSNWSGPTKAVFAFGHEVMVNVLQMVSAYAAIANNGNLMKLHLIKRIVAPDGDIIAEKSPQFIRSVVSPDIARRIKKILHQVVERGTGKAARVKGLTIAGKTGTARKVVGGRYLPGKTIASFVGFAPLESPAVAAIIVIDEPVKQAGGRAAAPYFGELMKELALLKPDLFPSLWKKRMHEGVRKVFIPNLVMLTRSEAESVLAGRGIKTIFKGEGEYILRQSPPAGRLVRLGGGLVLEMGAPSVDDGVLPDVTGFPIRSALVVFSRLGLPVEIEGSGFVERQSISPDSCSCILLCSERRRGS